jgi:ribosomal protein S18 acetylase RimI-like enzyme
VPFRRLFQRQDPATAPSQVGPAPDHLRPQGLAEVLGRGVVGTPNFERRAAAQGLDLSRLWLATDGDSIRAAALLIPHPGRTGLLLASAPDDERHAQLVGRTCAGLLEAAAGSGIRLVQALSSPGESLRTGAWAAAGLRHLASLDYMERPRDLAPRPRALPDGITLTAWDPADRGLLEGLLPRTYEETLDCPGLASMREPGDILEGHLAVGEHDPRLWTVAWQAGEPVGALLLSPAPESDSLEVVYLGMVLPMRGKGLGSALLSHGLAAVHPRRERTVALAVDARNTPAVALYARAGFRTVRRREAFVAAIRA